jgi:hypothetical protein
VLVNDRRGDIRVGHSVVKVHPQGPRLEQDEARCRFDPDSCRVRRDVDQGLVVRELWNGQQHLYLHRKRSRRRRLRNASIGFPCLPREEVRVGCLEVELRGHIISAKHRRNNNYHSYPFVKLCLSPGFLRRSCMVDRVE